MGVDYFAICVLLVILFSIINSAYLIVRSHKVFLGLVLSILLLLVLEIVTRKVNGLSYEWAFYLNNVSNVLLYIVNPFPTLFWLFYFHIQIHDEESKMPGYVRFFIFLVIIHAFLAILSPFWGIFFHVDRFNIYHRGQYYFITAILDNCSILIPLLILPFHRREISAFRFFILLIFPLIPGIAGIIQIIDYNLTTIWSSTTLSILLVFVNLQNRLVNQDHLTGLANRRQIDHYLSTRIREAACGESFSLLMIDLDGFKKINDQFGHVVGDEALETTAAIISSTLRKDDFVGRYAGDEFIIVLSGVDKESVEATVNRLKKAAENFNLHGEKVYGLKFSIGYYIYDSGNPETLKELTDKIDAHMYLDKRSCS